jgi:hypothetical protein
MSYREIEPGEVTSHDEIRITTDAGYQEFLWEPQVRADILIGRRASGDTLRVSLEDIREIEASKTDAVKTAGLALGIAGTAVVALAVIVYVSLVESDDCLGLCTQ